MTNRNRNPIGPTVRARGLTFVAATLVLVLVAGMASAQDGEPVRTVESTHGFDATTSRLEQAIEEQGLTIVTTIDHAANAANADLELAPTTLFVFGNPQVGTPLMQSARTIALDLPQKMLVWEDAGGDVFVSYRDPRALATDHGLAPDEGPLPNVADLLGQLARTAAGTE